MKASQLQGAKGAGGHLVRGPHLAAVELEVRRLQLAMRSGDGSESVISIEAEAEAVAEAILSYFRVASTKVGDNPEGREMRMKRR